MTAQSVGPSHIDITETLVRLYVFLAQSLDRCLDQQQQGSLPEKDHQAFLSETRRKLMEVLQVNPVVKRKVQEECDEVLRLAESYLRAGDSKTVLLGHVKAARAILTTKLLALSDLLAVFRAL
jgi:hypothetical protein